MPPKFAKPLTNNEIIADTLGRAPDVTVASSDGCLELSRWRQFVGDYTLPALADPVYVVHLAGTSVQTWDKKAWSQALSIPGCTTIVPASCSTGWLVNGELDTVTLNLSLRHLKGTPAEEQFKRMRFAFSDPLSVELTKQIVAELYSPPSDDRKAYITQLVDTLKVHLLRGHPSTDIPVNVFAANRIHQVISMILNHPEKMFSIEALAEAAGVTEAHFCRIFKQGTGLSPHRFILKAKLERAQYLLSQSSLSINTIADQLGFASQSHFSRAFRSFAGCTPSEHRSRLGTLIQ